MPTKSYATSICHLPERGMCTVIMLDNMLKNVSMISKLEFISKNSVLKSSV